MSCCLSIRTYAALPALLTILLLALPTSAKGVESTHMSLPKSPGSIEGLGRDFAPSLASGTAGCGLDIAMPPSAGGFAPTLSLDYDSAGGATSVGMGWRIGGIACPRRLQHLPDASQAPRARTHACSQTARSGRVR